MSGLSLPGGARLAASSTSTSAVNTTGSEQSWLSAALPVLATGDEVLLRGWFDTTTDATSGTANFAMSVRCGATATAALSRAAVVGPTASVSYTTAATVTGFIDVQLFVVDAAAGTVAGTVQWRANQNGATAATTTTIATSTDLTSTAASLGLTLNLTTTGRAITSTLRGYTLRVNKAA